MANQEVPVNIDVRGRRLTIDADLRGPGQNRTQRYLRREWSVGLGVLVVILPIAAQEKTSKVGATRGRRVRHVGRTPRT